MTDSRSADQEARRIAERVIAKWAHITTREITHYMHHEAREEYIRSYVEAFLIEWDIATQNRGLVESKTKKVLK